MTSLRRLIEQASGYAETLFDPDDVMFPHFVAEDATGGITVAAIAAGSRDLDRMRAGMAQRFALDRYRRWVFFAESWLVEYDGGRPTCEPCQHPERIEVVQFDALDIGSGRRLRGSRQILRQDGTARLMPMVFRNVPVVDVPSGTARNRTSTGAPA